MMNRKTGKYEIPKRELFLRVLRKTGKPMTRFEISHSVGKSLQYCDTYLNALHVERMVKKTVCRECHNTVMYEAI